MAERTIRIDLGAQTLELRDGDETLCRYRVSTARNGPGERNGSECTPRGLHEIHAKIGTDAPEGAVFAGRQATGEICGDAEFALEPERDWILTRILWLAGCESGRNLGGEVDTLRRMIYIHGTPDVARLGQPMSHGCIRMHNRDVLELYPMVELGTAVELDD